MRNDCREPDIANISPHIIASMQKRGWTVQEINEAYQNGTAFTTVDLTASNAPATRFVHPATGKSIVVNNQTGSVIHVDNANFEY